MMQMRIVAINSHTIWIQVRFSLMKDWEQSTMSFEDFDTFMADNFPKSYADYLKQHKSEQWAAEFFYNYKCSPTMRRKGIAHIFSR